MAELNLINEVCLLEKPERFKPRQIDGIIKKHISEGMSISKARELLLKEGFKLTEEDSEKPMEGCGDCEVNILVGRYDYKPTLSLIYDYGIVVEIGFRDGKVASVHGWHVKNAY